MSPAPLELIDAAIAAGQPAIVQVDSSPAEGIQTHWVVIYAKRGEDYLMLDPWPYQPDISKEDLLMKRYARGNPLRRAISHVILYEVFGSGLAEPAPTPSTPATTSVPTDRVPALVARVKDSVTWGLNIRSTVDTSSMANVLEVVPAGAQLILLELDGTSKIGAINQWVRVRTPNGREGFAAAWYLETVKEPPVVSAPPPETPSAPSTPSEPPEEEKQDDKLTIVVSSAVGMSGLRLRKSPSKGGALVAVLKAGTRLTVLEPAKKAKAKIGKANQWLHVRSPGDQRGYVSAEFVSLP